MHMCFSGDTYIAKCGFLCILNVTLGLIFPKSDLFVFHVATTVATNTLRDDSVHIL